MITIRKIGKSVLYAFVALQITAGIGLVAAAAIGGGGQIDTPAVEHAHQHRSFI